MRVSYKRNAIRMERDEIPVHEYKDEKFKFFFLYFSFFSYNIKKLVGICRMHGTRKLQSSSSVSGGGARDGCCFLRCCCCICVR